jgi:hypothetical protein
MQRFPLSKIRFCRAVLFLTVGLGSSSFVTSARADEFSVVPKGDPIYAQLSNLARPGVDKIAPTLTRYEAALQTARFILNLQGENVETMSGSNWRSLKALTIALKSELRHLGIDTEATLTLTESNLEAFEKPDLSIPASKRNQAPRRGVIAPTTSLLRPSNIENPRVKVSNFDIPISQRLHASAALTAIERNGKDPLDSNFSGRSGSSLAEKSSLKQLSSQASLAYNLNPSLMLRASNSKVSSQAGELPLLSAPFLNGASEVSETGGGLDINVGSGIKLSTELARLRGDNGAQASRVGGGASLSAFQNRLIMSMSLSRLSPDNAATLPSTAAQVGVGLDLTRRLSLSLLYQGLFTESTDNTSRVSGGFSLNF